MLYTIIMRNLEAKRNCNLGEIAFQNWLPFDAILDLSMHIQSKFVITSLHNQ